MSNNKKTKRGHSSPNLMLRREHWMVELQRAQNPHKVMYTIKAALPKYLTEELFTWIQSRPSLSQRFLGYPFPRASREWITVPVANNTDYDREVWWCYLRVRSYASEISEFLTFSEAYEQQFIRGDYAKCLELLASVYSKFGYSLWLVKRQIHVLQIAKGLEEQKKFANTLINVSGRTLTA